MGYPARLPASAQKSPAVLHSQVILKIEPRGEEGAKGRKRARGDVRGQETVGEGGVDHGVSQAPAQKALQYQGWGWGASGRGPTQPVLFQQNALHV